MVIQSFEILAQSTKRGNPLPAFLVNRPEDLQYRICHPSVHPAVQPDQWEEIERWEEESIRNAIPLERVEKSDFWESYTTNSSEKKCNYMFFW
jgi:hypothetical protein